MDFETVLAVARWILVVAAVAATCFPLLYLRSPWWRSWLGRATMIQSVAVMVLLDLSVVGNFFPDWFGPEDLMTLLWVQIVIISAIGLTSATLTVMLFRLQRDRGRHRGPQRSPQPADDDGRPDV